MINNYTAWGLTYSIFSLVIMRAENDDVVKKKLVSDTSQTPKFSGSHWAPGFPAATEKNRFPFPTAAAPRSQCHELMVCGSQVKWITKYTNHTSTVTSMNIFFAPRGCSFASCCIHVRGMGHVKSMMSWKALIMVRQRKHQNMHPTSFWSCEITHLGSCRSGW